jgi:hypothetical protein
MDKKILYDTWAFIALIAAYIQKSPLIITLRLMLMADPLAMTTN